jgi:hypothetical protein
MIRLIMLVAILGLAACSEPKPKDPEEFPVPDSLPTHPKPDCPECVEP